jgi:undecaprenyl-diphosphatase
MSLFEILVLAVVQGITEFLPISSDGHLVLVFRLLGSASPEEVNFLSVEVVLHAGTLISILVMYWNRAWRLLGQDRRVLGLVILATVPAAVVGLIVEKYFETIITNPWLAGLFLPINGAMLLYGRTRSHGTSAYQNLSIGQALLIGLAQPFAILPGISRSGSTIVTGMATGLRPDAAADFSFLMAIPVIGGACLLKGVKLFTEGTGGTPAAYLGIGVAVSAIVGVFAIRWLIQWLQRDRLHWFAYWCMGVGAASLAWQLIAPSRF